MRNHPVTQKEVNKDTVLDTFGKNRQVQKICRALFITTAGLVQVEVVDRLQRRESSGSSRGWSCE